MRNRYATGRTIPETQQGSAFGPVAPQLAVGGPHDRGGQAAGPGGAAGGLPASPAKRRTSGRGGAPLLLQLPVTLQGGIGQGLQIRRQQAASGQPLQLRPAGEALPGDHFVIIEQ